MHFSSLFGFIESEVHGNNVEIDFLHVYWEEKEFKYFTKALLDAIWERSGINFKVDK